MDGAVIIMLAVIGAFTVLLGTGLHAMAREIGRVADALDRRAAYEAVRIRQLEKRSG